MKGLAILQGDMGGSAFPFFMPIARRMPEGISFLRTFEGGQQMFNWFHTSDWAGSIMRVNCSVLFMMSFVTYTLQESRGETIILQNEAIPDGSAGALQYGFKGPRKPTPPDDPGAPGDIVASVFELPPGVGAAKITKIETIWQVNPEYGCLQSVVDVKLFCGAFPNPGAPVATKVGAVLTCRLNPMDMSGDNWIVQSGAPFTVGLQYSWTVGPFKESSTHIVTDTDGCQIGKNLAYEGATNSWYDPCASVPGWPGDFAIRVTAEAYPSKAPFGDYNHDGTVDMVDFAEFQRCATSDSYTPSPECVAAFDCDRDGTVNVNDLTEFMTCARGPGIALDPACGVCWPVGLCNNPLAGRLLTKLKGGESNPKMIPPLLWLIIAVILAGGGTVAYFLYGQDEVVAARNAWIGDSRCPHKGYTDSNRLQEAIQYLRDTLGATDPEAQKIGKFLYGPPNGGTFAYWNCDGGAITLIAKGPNTKYQFYAMNPIGTQQIFIDKRFLEEQHSKEVLALLFYSEATHFLGVSGLLEPSTSESACQKRLDAFRNRHPEVANLIPEMHHGLSEGFAEE